MWKVWRSVVANDGIKKFYQLQCRCLNCRREAPYYFEYGKKIAWKEINKVCGICGIDAGWVASE